MRTSQHILGWVRRHALRAAVGDLVALLAAGGLVAASLAPAQVLAEEPASATLYIVWASNDPGFGSPGVTAGVLGAQATTKALSTNFTLVNLGSSSNELTIHYYKPDGSPWRAPETVTLANQGDQLIRRQYNDTLLPTGSGSVVVDSQGPLGGTVQILTRERTVTRSAYSGVVAGASEAYAPYVAKGIYSASGFVNSQLVVQNTGDLATDVTIELISAASGAVAGTKIIDDLQPRASQLYDLSTDANVPRGFFGSARVRAAGGGAIAAIANVFSGSDTLQTYNAYTSPGQVWLAPLFTVRLANTLSTPLAVQNLSGGAIPAGGINVACTRDATLSTGPASFSLANTEVVGDWATYFFNPVTNTPAPGMPDQWYGSCRITTTGYDTVAMVQMRVVRDAAAGAYEAIKADGAHKKVVVPLYAKRLSCGFASVVTIQNLNADVPTNVSLQYQGAEGMPANCTAKVTASIPAGGSLQQNHRLGSGPQSVPAVGDACYGTIVVTSTDQPIDGIVQFTNISCALGDTLQVSNVFPVD